MKYNPRAVCYTHCLYCKKVVQSVPDPVGTVKFGGTPVRSAHVDHVWPYCDRFDDAATRYNCVNWNQDAWYEGRPN